jgi:hypothetical protein
LRYEPDTGKLFWRPRKASAFATGQASKIWHTRFSGKEAFTAVAVSGYRVGTIFGSVHLAHRVVWAIETGAWPVATIDHINRDKQDNRFQNLREATHQQNLHNKGVRKDSATGFKGVYFFADRMKWQARIRVEGKNKSLGYFDTPEQARDAYARASDNLHGDFANKS